MRRIFKEKLQYEVPANHNEDELAGKWASSESARTKKGTRDTLDTKYNHLGPGMNNEAQHDADIRPQHLSNGNRGHGDQFTTDVTVDSLRKGFSKKSLSPTDNSVEAGFYDDVTVDGHTGFLERRNVLDRN